jgi:hypothetical protein
MMPSPADTAPPSSSASSAAAPNQQGGVPKERRMESLGWLTESTVMPKKHKAIEGVGAASILDLKAQLYRTQEEARNSAPADAASGEFRRAKKRSGPADPLGAKNSGVDARAHKYVHDYHPCRIYYSAWFKLGHLMLALREITESTLCFALLR